MKNRKKPFKEWIKENREEIDRIILGTKGMRGWDYKFNDEKRYVWILNHEELYNWALSENVNV